MSKSVIVALACVLTISACAGRDAAPVSVVQTYDRDLSCDQVAAEIASNETKIDQLQNEHDEAHDRNVGIGIVGGLLFWPALFALDTGDAEKIEIGALRDRNSHLARFQFDQDC